MHADVRESVLAAMARVASVLIPSGLLTLELTWRVCVSSSRPTRPTAVGQRCCPLDI